MKKIAFIGMMGCGKSSIANDISKDLALKLISIDKMVEKEINLSISDIFEKFGEPYFRKIETKVLKNAVINGNNKWMKIFDSENGDAISDILRL